LTAGQKTKIRGKAGGEWFWGAEEDTREDRPVPCPQLSANVAAALLDADTTARVHVIFMAQNCRDSSGKLTQHECKFGAAASLLPFQPLPFESPFPFRPIDYLPGYPTWQQL